MAQSHDIFLKSLRRVALASVVAALVFPAMALAVDIPGQVNPGRVNQQFQSAPVNPPKVASPLIEKPALSVPAPKGSDKVFLTLKSLEIQGMTAYGPEEFQPLYQDLIGTRVPLSKIYEIASAIADKYHADGYAFAQVSVPYQKIGGGAVRLVVIEGYIDSVNVKAPKATQDKLKSRVEKILATKPFNVRALERQLLLLNDLYGITVRSVIEPKAKSGAPGAVDLTLLVKKEKATTDLSFDNFGSRPLGQEQVGARHNRGLGLLPFDKLSMGGFVSTQVSELQYVFLGYEFPISDAGTKFGISANGSWTEPGYPLEQNELKGSSYNAELKLSHPVIRSRSQNLSVSGIFDIQNTENDVLSTLLFEDKVRALRASAIYDVADNWAGTNLMDARVSQGLNILGARETGSENLSREDAHSDFTKLEASFARWQGITQAWTLYASVSGQVASAPLPSSEEFGYGGQVYGRAYNASEITGDDGAAGSVELRYTGLPPLPWEGGRVEPFGFYDIGVVHNRDNFIENDTESGASAGFGTRFNVTESVDGSLTLAFPLTLPVAIPSPGGNPGSGRVFFSLNYSL